MVSSEKYSRGWEKRELSENYWATVSSPDLRKCPLLTQSRKFYGIPILKKGFHEQILDALID